MGDLTRSKYYFIWQGILRSSTFDLRVTAYCDSDWGACPRTRRSLSSYVVLLGDSLVSWKTKKQDRVSLSSAEAEYRSMTAAVQELLWIKELLESIGISHHDSMKLICDSKSALHIAANLVFHEHTKHIENDCHFIRDEIKRGTVATSHVRTTEQLADLLTKALGRQQFTYLLGKLGVCDLHAPTWGGVLRYSQLYWKYSISCYESYLVSLVLSLRFSHSINETLLSILAVIIYCFFPKSNILRVHNHIINYGIIINMITIWVSETISFLDPSTKYIWKSRPNDFFYPSLLAPTKHMWILGGTNVSSPLLASLEFGTKSFGIGIDKKKTVFIKYYISLFNYSMNRYWIIMLYYIKPISLGIICIYNKKRNQYFFLARF